MRWKNRPARFLRRPIFTSSAGRAIKEPSPRGFCGGGSIGSAAWTRRRSPLSRQDDGRGRKEPQKQRHGREAKGARPSPRGFCGGGL